jgi:hypothetical protein
MGEIKEYIADRLTIILVSLNAALQYFGIENIKSTILWFLTITLLIFKIKSEFLKYKKEKNHNLLEIEIKKEELKLKKIKNNERERDAFLKSWKNENDKNRN